MPKRLPLAKIHRTFFLGNFILFNFAFNDFSVKRIVFEILAKKHFWGPSCQDGGASFTSRIVHFVNFSAGHPNL